MFPDPKEVELEVVELFGDRLLIKQPAQPLRIYDVRDLRCCWQSIGLGHLKRFGQSHLLCTSYTLRSPSKQQPTQLPESRTPPPALLSPRPRP
jgi:hypothetical protein